MKLAIITSAMLTVLNLAPSCDFNQSILVLVGIATAGFICWQSWETHRAATATNKSADVLKGQSGILEQSVAAAEKSAQAALLSVETMRNAERPWMFIEIEKLEQTISQGDQPIFTVKFVNQGRTPAEVVSLDFHLDSRNGIDDFPIPPTYLNGGFSMVSTRMIAPGRPFALPGEPYINLPDNYTSETWDEIKRSQRRATCWGKLVYRDLIKRPASIHVAGNDHGILHETCFCYFWSPRLNEFLITGPLGYNKHT